MKDSAMEMMKDYGEGRQESCKEVAERLGNMIKDMQRLKEKAEWAATAKHDERVNLGTVYIDSIESQLQVIRKALVNIEKNNAVLDILRDME